jgi:hypothetical protein
MLKIPQTLFSSFQILSHFCITKVGTTFACTQETHIQTFTHKAKKINNKKQNKKNPMLGFKNGWER